MITDGLLYLVNDLDKAREALAAKRLPAGHSFGCSLLDDPSKAKNLYDNVRVQVAVVSWSVWMAVHVDKANVMVLPIRWERATTKYRAVKEYDLKDTLIVLMLTKDWVADHSRQIGNMASSLASLLHAQQGRA